MTTPLATDHDTRLELALAAVVLAGWMTMVLAWFVVLPIVGGLWLMGVLR